MDDETQKVIKREIVEALLPITDRHGLEISVLVHPPDTPRRSEDGSAAPTVFFFYR